MDLTVDIDLSDVIGPGSQLEVAHVLVEGEVRGVKGTQERGAFGLGEEHDSLVVYPEGCHQVTEQGGSVYLVVEH